MEFLMVLQLREITSRTINQQSVGDVGLISFNEIKKDSLRGIFPLYSIAISSHSVFRTTEWPQDLYILPKPSQLEKVF